MVFLVRKKSYVSKCYAVCTLCRQNSNIPFSDKSETNGRKNEKQLDDIIETGFNNFRVSGDILVFAQNSLNISVFVFGNLLLT